MNDNRLKKIQAKIDSIRDSLSQLKGQRTLLESQITEKESLLEDNKELHLNMKKAVEVVNLVQESSQELVKTKFEEIVTNFIRFVTEEDDYEFQIVFGKKGNLGTAKFGLRSPTSGENYLPISECVGGGLRDIISVSLKVITMQFLNCSPTIMLDESFKALSSNYTEKAVQFLNSLTEDLGYQTFLITHREAIKDSFNHIIEIGN